VNIYCNRKKENSMAIIGSAQKVYFDTIRSLAYGSISGTYAGIGTTFTQAGRIIKITNNTDADIFISFDGVDDQDMLPAFSANIYDFSSNRIGPVEILQLSAGQRAYARQISASPTVGGVYLTFIYAAIA
jgi:hypothetical protein